MCVHDEKESRCMLYALVSDPPYLVLLFFSFSPYMEKRHAIVHESTIMSLACINVSRQGHDDTYRVISGDATGNLKINDFSPASQLRCPVAAMSFGCAIVQVKNK